MVKAHFIEDICTLCEDVVYHVLMRRHTVLYDDIFEVVHVAY